MSLDPLPVSGPAYSLRQRWITRRQRLKRVLRLLPRRSNVHRYPVIHRFASAARARPYLWRFRREQLRSALYVGCVLALMPTYGLQVLLAFFAAVAARANLTVMVGLQMITNPLTIAPVYWLTHETGRRLIELTGYGDQTFSVGGSVNALVLGGLVVGLALAFLLDLMWRLLAWEARRFIASYRAQQLATEPPDA